MAMCRSNGLNGSRVAGFALARDDDDAAYTPTLCFFRTSA